MTCIFPGLVVSQSFGPTLPRFTGDWGPEYAVYTQKCIFMRLVSGDLRALWILDHELNVVVPHLDPADPDVIRNLYLGEGPSLSDAEAAEVDEQALKDLVDLGDLLGRHSPCFQPGYPHLSFQTFDAPQTERQARIMSFIRRLKADAYAVGEGYCFPQFITYEQYEKGSIEADNDEGDTISWRFFFMVNNFDFLGYNDHPEWSSLVLLVSSHEKHIVGVLDTVEGVTYEFEPRSRDIFPRALTLTCFLKSAISKRLNDGPTSDRAHCFREYHIGHYIWNELSTLGICLKPGRRLSVFVHYLCDEPLYPVDEVFPELASQVFRNVTDFELVRAAFIEKHNFFPYSTFKITTAFRERVLKIAERKSAALDAEIAARKDEGRKVVLIGLRLENRMWPEQFNGYKALIRALIADGGSYHIIFDGHNYIGNDSTALMNSHMETVIKGEKSIAEIEKEKVEKFLAWYRSELSSLKRRGVLSVADSPPVTIESIVPCPVSDSIIAALRCDYFITHWGAGLAKYKWLANGRGGVFSSRSVINYKYDVRIYDTELYLEDALALDFMPSEKAQILPSNDASLLRFEGADRENFTIKPKDFADWAVERIKSIA